jgi:hypothetical protein
MEAAHATQTYRVQRAPGGWSVDRADACLGVFVDPAEAVDLACRSARDDAAHDCLAIVTAQTTPQEFHCFVPAQGHDQGQAAAPLPSYLRLLVDNDDGRAGVK